MIADIHGGLPWRIDVVAGASPVFLLAFAATMYDMLAPGLACGLRSEKDDPKEPPACWTGLRSIWSPKSSPWPRFHVTIGRTIVSSFDRTRTAGACISLGSVPETRARPQFSECAGRILRDPVDDQLACRPMRCAAGGKQRRNQSLARRATSSSVPGSSNRCDAPWTISS